MTVKSSFEVDECVVVIFILVWIHDLCRNCLCRNRLTLVEEWRQQLV